MIFVVGDNKYRVTFRHNFPTPEDKKLSRRKWQKRNFGSFATISRLESDGKTWTQLGTGCVFLSHLDKYRYSRRIGRKISFCRVLENLFPNKEDRKAIYSQLMKLFK